MMKTRLKNTLIIFLIAVIAISTVNVVSAAEKTIGPNTPGGLKKAIDTAKNGDTIILTNGVYKGKNNRDIAIKKYIKIIGKGNNVVLDGEGKYRFLKIAKNKKVTLQKLKFTKGSSKGDGGAIESEGTLTVSSCTFTDNQGRSGGSIRLIEGQSTVTKSIFTNNKAKISGGAISVFKGYGKITTKLTMNSCTFTNNTVHYAEGDYLEGRSTGFGGAIQSNGEITVSKSTFTNNKVGSTGGAIRSDGKATVNGCTFKNNLASTGGAIYNFKYTMKITDSNFKDNKNPNRGDIFGIFSYKKETLITKNIKLI